MGLRWYLERIQRLEQEMAQLKLENERLKKDLLQLKELRELHLKLLRELHLKILREDILRHEHLEKSESSVNYIKN
jgi:hypothetical protein